MNPDSRLSIIVAMAKNRVIGINNTLAWHLPADLKHFKALTMGHHIVMGRKTYESIGRPLPGRTSVVVTRDRELKIEGCVIAHSLEQGIAACDGDDKIFVIGGAELYAQALPIADKLLITEIQLDVPGDAYFPDFRHDEWQEISREVCSQQVPQLFEYHYAVYQRKQR